MPTSILHYFLPTTCLALVSTSIALAAPGIDFKGIPLGMTLEDFRILQHPDGIENTEVICSSDEDLNSYQAFAFRGGEALSAAGVVRCVFGGGRNPDTTALGTIPLSIGDSGFSASAYEFRFASNVEDGERTLYEIDLRIGSEARRYLIDALSARFGSTSSHSIGNKSVLTKKNVHREFFEWSDGHFSLSIDIPWSKADDMLITYRDALTATAVENRLGKSK